MASSDFNILRTEPKVCKLLRDMHNGTLDQKAFPYVEEPKNAGKKEEKKNQKGAATLGLAAESSSIENPRLFVYVVGGLSHHEICSTAVL